MPKEKKIDYIEFHASDFAAIQKFYEQVFQWKFSPYGEDYLAFNDGKLDGGFSKGDAKSTSATGAALVILYAEDLEATQAAVEAAGGTISREIFSFPGGRRFQFLDPHGNELGVWSDK
jgi:predicted enzyme related to lactoylglutathione lyase